MARPKVPQFWIDAVRIIALNEDPQPSAPEIHRRLGEWAAETGRSDGPPSVRKVVDLVREAKRLAEDEKREYELFTWPGSMEAKLLPWEASRDLLDLGKRGPILVRFAQWYWQASMAMPGASIDERYRVAGVLAARSQLEPHPEEAAELMAYLAFRAWTPDGQKEYEAAVEAGRV